MAKYQIFSDSCCDIPTDLRHAHDIEYVRMNIVVDGVEKHADLDWEEYKPEEFYGWLASGKKIKTNQIPMEEFIEKFSAALEKGLDIIYIGCSSALTGSMNVLNLCKEDILAKYPGRKIIAIDSLTAAGTLGLLVLEAAKKRDEGLSIEELEKWVEDNKFKFNQFATVDTLTYLKNAGRIKGSKAVMGNLFHKKPIFISDRKGNNYTLGTVTGTKNADAKLFEGIKNRIDKEKCNTVVICQGMAMDRALRLKKRFEDELKVEVLIWWIGPIIGTTCGPGVLATFCYGKEVTCFEGDGKPTDMTLNNL